MKSIGSNITTFEINPEYDIQGYEQIARTAPIGIRPTNLLALPNDISDAVNAAFSDNASHIIVRVTEIKTAWKAVEQRFLDLSLRFFNLEDIPQNAYTCYPTICPLIARDPINHRVAFPYDSGSKLACYVIAHELLHEFFYHHLHNTFGDKIDLNRKDIWDFSEIIDVLIMQEKEWLELLSIKAEPYEIHKELFFKLKSIWDRDKNVDTLVKEFIFKSK